MGKKRNRKNSPNKNKESYNLRSSSSKSGASGTDTEEEQSIANNNNMPSSASSVTNPSTPPPADNSPPLELDHPPVKEGPAHVAAAKLPYKEAAVKAVANFPPGTSSPAQGLTQRKADSSQPNKETPPDSVDNIPTSGFDTTPKDSNMGGKKLALTKPRTKGMTDWEGRPLDKGQTTICFVKEGDNNIETAKVGTITTPKGKSNDLSPIPESLEELIHNNPMGSDMADILHAHSNQINTIMDSINNMDKSTDMASLKDSRENLEQVTAAATSKLEHINSNMKQLDEDLESIKTIRSNFKTML